MVVSLRFVFVCNITNKATQNTGMIACMYSQMLCNRSVTFENNLSIRCAEMSVRANAYFVINIYVPRMT